MDKALQSWLARIASSPGWTTLMSGDEHLFHYACAKRLVEFQHDDNEFGDSVIYVRAPGKKGHDPYARLELDPPMRWFRIGDAESFRFDVARPGMIVWLQSDPKRPVLLGHCSREGLGCEHCDQFTIDDRVVAYQRVWIGQDEG